VVGYQLVQFILVEFEAEERLELWHRFTLDWLQQTPILLLELEQKDEHTEKDHKYSNDLPNETAFRGVGRISLRTSNEFGLTSLMYCASKWPAPARLFTDSFDEAGRPPGPGVPQRRFPRESRGDRHDRRTEALRATPGV
jgi:hypothetical protein